MEQEGFKFEEEMPMYQSCPYFRDYENRNDDYRSKGWYGSRPYGYPSPYFYGYGWDHHGWDGHDGWDGHHGWDGHDGGSHHGWHRDEEENENNMRNDCGKMCKPMPEPMPAPYPMKMPVVPIQPMPIKPIIMKPTEKNYNEFNSVEKNVNIIEINNTILQIQKKHPYMMKKLLMLGLVEAECIKVLYLTLMCSGKFDL